ncbi:hypothetical protein MMC17_009233 [Xylographa soralifera]|nr:hypothetical protein [Xylographa soralifera]
MAPSPNITASRVLHVSTSRAISQAPRFSTIVLASSLFSTPASQSHTALPSSTRRRFWCGRNGFRIKASSNTAIYHKCLEAQQRIAKYKSGRAPLAPIRSGYPFYYCRGQGWRLASSWGKSEDKSNQLLNDKSKAEVDREKELKSEAEKWQEELNSYLERFRKRVERYPYETLFGASIRRGVWNPWDNQLNHWIRNLAKDEWISSRVTRQHQTSSQGLKPNEAPSPTPPVEKSSEARQPSAVSKTTEARTNEDVEIDLITLRRVQRKAPTSTDTNVGPSAGKEVDIPVKAFVPAKKTNETTSAALKSPVEHLSSPKSDSPKVKETVRSESPVDSPNKTSTTQKAWLAKEGFSEFQEKKSSCESPNQAQYSIPTASSQQGVPRIESSLDRHLRNLGPSTSGFKDSHTPLVYKAEENKTEDIDLLRASNVRASSGRLKKPISEPVGAREQRRSALRQRFEEKQKELEVQYAEEIANFESTETKIPSQHNSIDKHIVGAQQASSPVQMKTSAGLETALNSITSEPETTANVDAWGYDLTAKGLETSYQDELDNEVQSLENYFARQQQELMDAESEKKQKKLAATNAALEEEIEKQKAAMAAMENRRPKNVQSSRVTTVSDAGEGDISQSVHQFVGRGRWYKSKAPDASEEGKQKAKDITLVREIRQIYEDQYGVIDTKHTQPYVNRTMEGKEDRSVQEGLREYDEKIAMENKPLPTQGKIATTDLDSFEISRLGITAKTSGSPSASNTSVSMEPSKTEDLKPKSKIAKDPPSKLETKPENHIYKVLAFDEASQKVAIATTTTSMFESSLPPRSVPAILSHLEQPAKYFDHFEPLEAAGFELVAGSRNTLVFKQVRKEIAPPTKAMQDTINKFLQADLSVSSTVAYDDAALNILPKSNDQSNTDRNIEHTSPSEIEHISTVIQPQVSVLRDQTEANDIQKTLKTLEKKAKQRQGAAGDLASSSTKNLDHTEQTSGQVNASARKSNADLHDVVISTSWKMNGEQPVDDTVLRTGIDAIRPSRSETTISPKLGNSVNPIDGTTASSPPFTNSNIASPPTKPIVLETTPSKIVRREEEVFSGRNLTKEQYREQRRQQRLASRAERYQRSREGSRRNRRRIWRATKRIFLTGTWVAACFYLVGALWEEVYRPRERKRARIER